MPSQEWIKQLRSLNFTDSEAAIYLTALEQGEVTAQDLARLADVSRVTAYAAIERLQEMGLMSTVTKGKKHFFAAESPDRLVSLVRDRMQKMEAELLSLRSKVQDLKLLQRADKPVVRLFEGPEALRAIQDDFLMTKPKSFVEFANLDEIREVYKTREVLRSFYKQVQKIDTKGRALYLSNQEPASNETYLKAIPLPTTIAFPGDVFIYGNKIALSTFRGKHISVLVESEDLAVTLRALFDHLWSFYEKKMPPSRKRS